MSVTFVYDATHNNVGALPRGGLAAGYTTGTPGVCWTPADWAAHAGAVRICQSPGGTDETADVLDVERYAAGNGDAAGWSFRAFASFKAAVRPGQRWPALYTSANNVTALVDSLIAGGVTSGVNLWVANWNLSDAQATADVQNAAGPFPIVAMQFASLSAYDVSVFSTAWLARSSAPAPTDYMHVTDGKQTIGELAATRGMTALAWLAEQERLHPDDAANLTGAAVPPAGMTWWSVRP